MVKQNINVVEESEKLKITADDMRDFLKSKRKTLSKGKKRSVRLDKIVVNKRKARRKEFNLERKRISQKGAFGASVDNIEKTVKKGPMGLLDKVITLGTILFWGSVITTLPKIIQMVTGWITQASPAITGMKETVVNLFSAGKDGVDKLGEWTNDIKQWGSNLKQGYDSITPTFNEAAELSNQQIIGKPIIGEDVAERMFPSSERAESQKGSDMINSMFGHTTNSSNIYDKSNNSLQIPFDVGLDATGDNWKRISPIVNEYTLDDGVNPWDQNTHTIFMPQKVIIKN